MKSVSCLLAGILALGISQAPAADQSFNDTFTFEEAVGLYSDYYYNPVAGYVDSGGTVRRGRQITEHQSRRGKFRYVSGGTYNALTCSGFVVPVLARFLYGRAQWQEQLSLHWADYQLGGAALAGSFNLRLGSNLTHAQLTSPTAIQDLIASETLKADGYYLFTTSHAGGGHVGFVQVKADGTLKTYQYSDMNVRGLPLEQKRDPTDETYDVSKYVIGTDGTLYETDGYTAVTPVPVRQTGGMLSLIKAQRTSRPGYYEGPFLDWYLSCPYGRDEIDVQLYELTPPLRARVIYAWSSQSRDLDIGVSFLGSTMGWSHTNNSPYMSWTGDNTGYSGSETVTIDLQKALDDEMIAVETPVQIALAAGWYTPAGGTGPANVKAQLLRQDAVMSERQRVISPSTQRNASVYPVGNVTIDLGTATIELQ